MAALAPDARARVDEITRLIVEKLLLTPTEQLKASDEQMIQAYAEALGRLFSLQPEPDNGSGAKGPPSTPGAAQRPAGRAGREEGQ
jgi:hypothetical protein